jgi:hypothetical protein
MLLHLFFTLKKCLGPKLRNFEIALVVERLNVKHLKTVNYYRLIYKGRKSI